MMVTKVVNLRKEEYEVYIGRGSPFGNPFSHMNSAYGAIKVETREIAIESYKKWLFGEIELEGWTRPTIEQIETLRGKVLGCFCKPQGCHGDVLVSLFDDRSDG